MKQKKFIQCHVLTSINIVIGLFFMVNVIVAWEAILSDL